MRREENKRPPARRGAVSERSSTVPPRRAEPGGEGEGPPAAPARPLVVYDGDCGFCVRWISAWNRRTGSAVDYEPYQQAASRLPWIPVEGFRKALHLIETDGSTYTGAEAVFRALAHAPRGGWLLRAYRSLPGFAPVSERTYRFVADHRPAFSRATLWLYGSDPEPPSYALVRRLFTRLVAATFLIAFVSLWVQIDGLLGNRGILPAAKYMEAVARQLGEARWRLLPSLAWLSPNDRSLHLLCVGGALASFAATVGILQGPCLLFCWASYLSLASVGQEFLSFQWDLLLLEAGFLTAFFAPWRLWDRPSPQAPPSKTLLWLLRWLLFRLMFESGCVKLLSGDPTWRDLTALHYHYETQCLPTWIAWYANQLPLWFQKVSAASVFAIELAIPWLIFAPRRPRFAGCAALVLLQALIAATGNYGFFNLLTVTLCLTLLDDGALAGLLHGPRTAEASGAATDSSCGLSEGVRPVATRALPLPVAAPGRPARRLATAALAAAVLAISGLQLATMFAGRLPPRPAGALLAWVSPWRTVNSYGLFAVMTTTRNEIILEGSRDGRAWKAYELKWKPGDPSRRPAFVAPHQPRLDWQLWFAVLGSYQENPWVFNLMGRLFEGSPPVLALFKTDPFPGAPPKYLRALIYEYHFTSFEERRKTGAWWRRDLKGLYAPVVTMRR